MVHFSLSFSLSFWQFLIQSFSRFLLGFGSFSLSFWPFITQLFSRFLLGFWQFLTQLLEVSNSIDTQADCYVISGGSIDCGEVWRWRGHVLGVLVVPPCSCLMSHSKEIAGSISKWSVDMTVNFLVVWLAVVIAQQLTWRRYDSLTVIVAEL